MAIFHYIHLFYRNNLDSGIKELLWVTSVILSWQREINMSSTKEFESLEKILDEHLPAPELAEVKRILYGKPVE